MHENGMGHMHHPAVAGRVGHAMAEAVMRERREEVANRERRERGRQRRARVARMLRALATRLGPSGEPRRGATAA